MQQEKHQYSDPATVMLERSLRQCGISTRAASNGIVGAGIRGLGRRPSGHLEKASWSAEQEVAYQGGRRFSERQDKSSLEGAVQLDTARLASQWADGAWEGFCGKGRESKFWVVMRMRLCFPLPVRSVVVLCQKLRGP